MMVYSHLPEHTLNISNLLENDTNISPKYVVYWYEVDENTNYTSGMLMDNYNGMFMRV